MVSAFFFSDLDSQLATYLTLFSLTVEGFGD